MIPLVTCTSSCERGHSRGHHQGQWRHGGGLPGGRACAKLGAAGYVRKPFDDASLISAIENALAGCPRCARPRLGA